MAMISDRLYWCSLICSFAIRAGISKGMGCSAAALAALSALSFPLSTSVVNFWCARHLMTAITLGSIMLARSSDIKLPFLIGVPAEVKNPIVDSGLSIMQF